LISFIRKKPINKNLKRYSVLCFHCIYRGETLWIVIAFSFLSFNFISLWLSNFFFLILSLYIVLNEDLAWLFVLVYFLKGFLNLNENLDVGLMLDFKWKKLVLLLENKLGTKIDNKRNSSFFFFQYCLRGISLTFFALKFWSNSIMVL
jgi:hypothetical protein